jgi:hypothetical protein
MENYLRMIERTRGWILAVTQGVFAVLLVLAGFACSEDPTDQNSPTSPVALPGVIVRDTTIVALSDSTFKTYIPMDGASNLVGSVDGYTAISMLEFYPSYFTLRDTVNVLSAKIKLRLSYRYGASAGPLTFDVYQISRSWSPSTITWDSIQTGFYDATTKRGSFSGTIASDSDFIYVDLDTAMVRQWISSTTSADVKYGVVFVPTSTSAIRGFVQFSYGDSSSYYPTLEIVAAGTSGNTQDTTTYSSGMGTFVADVGLANDPTLMRIQSGIVYRSKLRFDVSFIPRGSIVNNAWLSLTVVPSATRLNSFTTDTTLQAHIGLTDDPASVEATYATISPASSALASMKGDISHAVQSWVRGPNYGLVIRSTYPGETGRLDLYGFSGVHATDAAARPGLKITYTLGK